MPNAVRRLTRFLLAVVAALVLAGPPTPGLAGAWDLTPVLGVGAGHDGDVNHGTGDMEESDSFLSADLSLPLTNTWRTGRFGITYEPTWESYRDRSDLDHLDHQATLELDSSGSRRRSTSLAYVFSSAERQGRLRAEDAANDAPVLVPRNRITRNGLHAVFNVAGSRKVGFVSGLAWDSVHYSADTEEIGLGDSDRYAVTVGASWKHSDAVATEYLVLAGRVEEAVEQRVFTSAGWRIRARLSSLYRLEATLGASRVDSDSDVEGTTTETTPTGGVALSRVSRDGASLEAGYNRRVGTTSGLGSVSINQSYHLAYRRPFSGRFTASVAANRTEREDVDRAGDSFRLETTLARAALEYAFTRTFALAAEAEHNEQGGDAPDASYAVYRLSLRWHPRGFQERGV